MKTLISFAIALCLIAALSCNNEQATNYTQNIDIKKITSNVSTNLNDVDFIDSHYGFIVGDSGTVIKTNNGGETWENIDVGLFLYLYEHNIVLSEVKALDFRNWCYKKERDSRSHGKVKA